MPQNKNKKTLILKLNNYNYSLANKKKKIYHKMQNNSL